MTTDATPVSVTPKQKPEDLGFSAVYAALIGYGQPRLLGDTHTLLPHRMDLIQKLDPKPNYGMGTGNDLVIEVHSINEFADERYSSDRADHFAQIMRDLTAAKFISVYHRQLGVKDGLGSMHTKYLVCELVSTPKAEELPW
jgi:hypothetical protein